MARCETPYGHLIRTSLRLQNEQRSQREHSARCSAQIIAKFLLLTFKMVEAKQVNPDLIGESKASQSVGGSSATAYLRENDTTRKDMSSYI